MAELTKKELEARLAESEQAIKDRDALTNALKMANDEIASLKKFSDADAKRRETDAEKRIGESNDAHQNQLKEIYEKEKKAFGAMDSYAYSVRSMLKVLQGLSEMAVELEALKLNKVKGE